VDVIAHALEVTATRSVHDQRLVAPREQVAEELVPPVEAISSRRLDWAAASRPPNGK
jgi:hypothetical protein